MERTEVAAPMSNESLPDRTEALAGRVASGEGAAFPELYARVAPALYAWARLRVRPPLSTRIDADDLVQEICCRAWQGFPRFDATRGAFRGWLFGIANHVLQKALSDLGRAPAGRRPTALDESSRFLEQVPDDATRASRRVARDETLAAFVAFAEELGDEDGRLLLYRGLEGLEHADVAELLGVETETAKKRWQRLRDRLQEHPVPAALLVD